MTITTCSNCKGAIDSADEKCETCGHSPGVLMLAFAMPVAATPEAVGAEIRRLLLTLRDPADTNPSTGHYGTDILRARALDLAEICWFGTGVLHNAEHRCNGRPECLDDASARYRENPDTVPSLKARLAAAEKERGEALSLAVTRREQRMEACVERDKAEAERDEAFARAKALAAGEILTAGIARLVDEQCARAYAERDEARALAAKMEKERDEARTEAECFRAGVLHPDPTTNAEVGADRDAARAFDAAAGIRDEWHKGKPDWEHRAAEEKARAERAEALAAMRGEALRGLLREEWMTYEGNLEATGHASVDDLNAARAALSGDAGEWLAAERRRVAEAVREACWKAQTGRGIESQPGWVTHDLRHLDLSALLEKLP